MDAKRKHLNRRWTQSDAECTNPQTTQKIKYPQITQISVCRSIHALELEAPCGGTAPV
jgi:hypothetical protein